MNTSALHRRLPSFYTVLLLSIFIRIALILYSEWHDRHSVVKYTDIDYRVFSDAARFLLRPGPGESNRAQGQLIHLLAAYGVPLNLGDPYTRETYRYTPLLALLLTPVVWLHPSFGKYIFAACDIINGILIYRLLVSDILPHVPKAKKAGKNSPSEDSASVKATRTEEERQALATLYSSIHLLNPLVFSISTRGSSEAVLSLFVLLTLYFAFKGRWDAAAIMLGLSTHWKIYPVIYGVACLGVIGGAGVRKARRGDGSWCAYLRTLVNRKTARFGLISAGTFFLLGVGCYVIWGYPFLYESYLYHAHRLDHRHNFSPYFYLTYLTYPPPIQAEHPVPLSVWNRLVRSPLVSFAPQMGMALGMGFLLGRRKEDLVFAWFVQTVVFVLFNKVCTSQYFLWYLLLLPLLLPRLATSRRRALVYICVWIGTQVLWLSEAYKLEFLGRNVFFGLWIRSLVSREASVMWAVIGTAAQKV
ncbi:putative mannosyltransferase (PIG-M) [Lyophyllum shimeji]|uniref:GPI mannosyltransferase 1 n=1 Tax=Lyophyllum shimeji TaxID=47721 RepID=A0A9P3PFI6_LYOSH|nr:putative mannosyltransferase (PIG-M) [Lyophyllum shimeji]